jgi:uncharacterized protein YodC (DUF2158 family)
MNDVKLKDYEVGDLVRIKSGGPVMTVEDASRVEAVGCVWFDRFEVRRDAFMVSMIIPYHGEPVTPEFAWHA